MTYPNLIAHLATNRLADDDYYTLLLTHATVIVDQVTIAKKQQVATDLGMTSQSFSQAYKFILASHNKNN